MTILFSDGFESGDFSAWTNLVVGSGDLASVVSSPVHHGNCAGSFYVDGAGAGESCQAYKSYDAVNNVYSRIYVRLDNNTPSVGNTFRILQYTGGATNSLIWVSDDSTFKLFYYNVHVATIIDTGVVCEVDKWYCIELHSFVDAVNGSIEAYIDGILVASVYGVDTFSHSGNINRTSVGEIWSSGATEHTVYVDCCVVSDSYIGCEPPRTLFRDGFESGDFSAWTSDIIIPPSTVNVTSTNPHHGNYSAKFDSSLALNNDARLLYNFASDQNTIYTRQYITIDEQTCINQDDRVFVLIIMATQYVAYAGFFKLNDGKIVWTMLTRNGADYVYTHSDIEVETGKRYCLELYWTKDAVNGSASMWLDGILICSINGQDTSLYGGAKNIGVGIVEKRSNVGVAFTAKANIDCVVVSEAYIGTEVSNRQLMGVGLGCVSSP